jgi:ABC-type branched-subunit amino acid transport system substrate-binding protein
VRIGGQAAEGALYTVNSTVDDEGHRYPEADRFYDSYQRKHGLGPDAIAYIALQYYEATYLLAAALRKLDEQRQEPTGEAIRDAMIGLRGFRSVYGPTEFKPDGTVRKPVAVKTIRDGRFVNLKVYGVDDIGRM